MACDIFCFAQLTFGRYIAVDETVSYEPHPQDMSKTLLKQEAVVTVQGIPLNNYMEDLLTSTIMHNANKVIFNLFSLVKAVVIVFVRINNFWK